MFDGMSNAAGIFTAAVHVCDKSLCYYAECYSQFQILLQYEVGVGLLTPCLVTVATVSDSGAPQMRKRDERGD